MKIGTWLLSLLQPAIAKILTSLGFAVVSIVGVSEALQGIKDQLISSMSTMPAAAMQIFLLGGGGVGLGIIMGAMTTRILLWQISNATRILGTNT